MINFHYEIPKFGLDEPRIINWIQKVVNGYQKRIEELNYIFCSDDYLRDLNIKYLKHNTLTDVISFDDSQGDALQGDIFISVDSVNENAEEFKVSFEEELNRVMIHGVLHFIGFKDKSPADEVKMRKAEDEALELIENKN